MKFPRSFKQLEKHLQKRNYDPYELKKWADRLLPYQCEGKDRIVSISQHFFESFGPLLAGNCGCSELFYDHQRIKVPETMQKDLLDEFSSLWEQGYFPETPSHRIARLMTVVFQLQYKESSLAVMLRKNRKLF